MFGFPFITTLVLTMVGVTVFSLVWHKGLKSRKEEAVEKAE